MDGEQTYRGAIPTWTKYGVMAVVYVVIHFFIGRLTVPQVKQWLSSCFGGLCIVVFMGPWYFKHFLVILLINIGIILLCKKSNRFHVSFFYSFLHLGYYFLLKYWNMFTPGLMSHFEYPLVALVLKMVHLAGEVQDVSELEQNTNQELSQRLKVYTNLSVMDILHYSFSHVSVISGFLSYRTYHDWIHHPLSQYAGHDRVQELKGIVAYCCGFIILTIVIMLTPQIEELEIATFQSLDPIWQCLYIQCAVIYCSFHLFCFWSLGDILLIISGPGVYPVSTSPRSGQGPTTNLALLEEIYNNPAMARQQKYNSDTIRHIFVYKAYTVPTMREFWRHYNCQAHQFLRLNVYLKFPIKRFRLLVTFMVCAYIHGWMLISYLTCINCVIYMEAEDIWRDIVKERLSKKSKRSVDLAFWLSRLFMQGQAFGSIILLKNFDTILLYYQVTCYIPVLYPITMFILGSCVQT